MFCFSELYVAFICRSGGAAALVLVRLGMGLAPVVLVTLPLVACDTTDERGGSRREIAARHDAAGVQWPQLPLQSALYDGGAAGAGVYPAYCCHQSAVASLPLTDEATTAPRPKLSPRSAAAAAIDLSRRGGGAAAARRDLSSVDDIVAGITCAGMILGISAGFRPSRRFSWSGLYSLGYVVSLAQGRCAART